MARFDSTSTPLAADGEWVSAVFEPRGADRLTGSVYADQPGTVFIEQAGGLDYGDPDAANWDVSTSYAVTADDGTGISEEILLPFVRVRYVNGATDQTEFRLRAQVQSAGGK